MITFTVINVGTAVFIATRQIMHVNNYTNIHVTAFRKIKFNLHTS